MADDNIPQSTVSQPAPAPVTATPFNLQSPEVQNRLQQTINRVGRQPFGPEEA